MMVVGWYKCIVHKTEESQERVMWFNGENFFKYCDYDTGACRGLIGMSKIKVITGMTQN